MAKSRLAPAGPYHLRDGVHDNIIVISGRMQASNIAIKGLRSDIAVLAAQDGAQAGVTERGLCVSVKEEDS